jgi:hypothetical protein
MNRSNRMTLVAVSASAAVAAPGSGQVFEISHNRVDDLVEHTVVVACVAIPAPRATTDNRWWRSFDLAAFGLGDITVREVRFGIEAFAAPSHGGQTDVTINLFQAPAGARPTFGLELRGTATASFPDQRLTVVSMEVEGCIDAGSSLVVQIAPQDFSRGETAGVLDAAALFGTDHAFLGANNRGETAPSYLTAPACGYLEPTTYDEIGIGGVAIVMTVIGERGHHCEPQCYADCDGSGSLDFFDFLCFQNAFAAGEPYADCDDSGSLDFFDFLCFQNEFAAGCL